MRRPTTPPSHTLAAALALAALVAFALPSVASAGDVQLEQARKAMEDAKTAYNAEKYRKASELYIRAAQLDPGAVHLEGAPYRNVARCMFWLEQFDKSVFWYQVYIRSFPDADDRSRVTSEKDAANSRRGSPDKPVAASAVYDKSLLQLVEALQRRLDAGEPAYTPDGGGTSRLYTLAIDKGYALPELAPITRALREDLMEEVAARFVRAPRSPLPLLGGEAEPIEASLARLDLLREMQPDSEQMESIAAYQLLARAFQQLSDEQYAEAAEGFVDAARHSAGKDYIPYAVALSWLQAGDGERAIKTIDASLGGAPEAIAPYYRLLRAEAWRLEGEPAKMTTELMAVLAPAETLKKLESGDGGEGAGKLKKLDGGEGDGADGDKGDGDESSGEPPRKIKTLGGSVGGKEERKVEE